MQQSKTNYYQKRKYHILWYFDQVLSMWQRYAAKKELPAALGVSEEQFNKYLYAKNGTTIEISAVKLQKISEYLTTHTGEPVSMEMLINNKQNEQQTA